ncbi:hypothetical protein KA107_03150 [Candidatus Pacearchaeota archaeon]|nr:hypothetical protein [Candidatus Pacearchaeota archaeon]
MTTLFKYLAVGSVIGTLSGGISAKTYSPQTMSYEENSIVGYENQTSDEKVKRNALEGMLLGSSLGILIWAGSKLTGNSSDE